MTRFAFRTACPSIFIPCARKLPRCFFFMAPQQYSIGLISGAYEGRRSVRNHADCVFIYSATFLDLCAGSPSQMSRSFFPCICRFKSLRKNIVSSFVSAPAIVRMKSFERRPSGVVVKTPTMVSFFHDPDDLRNGVFPTIAHVVRTVGFSEIPDSSSNPKRKPCFLAHFF